MIKKQILLSVALSLVCLLVSKSLYAIEVEGEVGGIWTIDDSPVSVQDTIFISADDTLTIEPGVIVNFAGPYSLLVYGELLAEGTEDDSIVFRPDEDVEFWCGIRADSGSVVTLDYCVVCNCTVGDEDNDIRGSALYCDKTELNVSNSSFYDNRSNWRSSGAISLYQCESVNIRRNVFARNDGSPGGALYIYRSYEIMIIENLFIENSSGAICATHLSSDIIISGNKFFNNHANDAGGAIGVGRLTHTEIYDNIFSNNTAGRYGGALFFDQHSPPYNFHSNTIVFNESAIGGGVCVISNHISHMSNCIFWGNRAEEAAQVYFYEYTWYELNLSYCDIEGEWPEEYGDHLIHEDPLFVDSDNNDFHLTGDSPCIDAGDPEADPDPDGTRADIGTFHFHQRDIEVEPDTILFETPGTIDSAAVTIRNIGLTTLTLNSQTITPDDSPFSIGVVDDEIEIEPESEITTWVRFIPHESGEYEAVLRIESDDPDEDVVEVPLIGTALNVEMNHNPLLSFGITSIYPNPFNSTTTIHYTLPSPADVTVKLYDIHGREVMSLVRGQHPAGQHQIVLNGEHLATGIYLCKLEEEKRCVVSKVLLVR